MTQGSLSGNITKSPRPNCDLLSFQGGLFSGGPRLPLLALRAVVRVRLLAPSKNNFLLEILQKEESKNTIRGDVSMYFVSAEHRTNYEQLVAKFNCQNVPDFESACYVVAHPEIWRKYNGQPGGSPVHWTFGEWNEAENRRDESEAMNCLSGAFRELARAAVEMFTGGQNHFCFARFIGNAGDEVYRVFIQAMNIRRKSETVEVEGVL
ncbi:DUF2538 family protein [Alicyclobacillus dauci]|uniref:DUF2538 family protein n=1 Tax=Alicyclobacillus dauci TaxID=1475485 RepID=A0ABY6Z6A0_9BACL|nr:DUF2538 family protein [Alicyclobacillus dauci]WAH38137.1 DUF2538 family protein [Alicyclobacillus dauci]